jgi:hypothetical protein
MAQLMLINPRRRRAATTRKRRRVRRNPANPIVYAAPRRRRRMSAPRVRRRIRRNPALRGGGLMNDLMQAGIGAAGAIGTDMIYGMLPLPVTMKTGLMQPIGRAAVALAIGTMGRRFLGRAAGQMAAGALTVIAYDVFKGFMGPATPLKGLGWAGSAPDAGYAEMPQAALSDYPDMSGMGGMGGMGEYVPMGDVIPFGADLYGGGD